MKNPLVSIITPCYNGDKYVNKLLDSVLAQTYSPIELIAVNDGSTDNTQEVLESYKTKFESKGIKYSIVSQKNGGLPNAINAGLKLFNGKYINFIDCDDYLTIDSIEKRVKILEEDKSLDVVWSATNIIDEFSGKITEVWGESHDPTRKSLFEDMIYHDDYVWVSAAKLVRASAFLEIYPNKTILDKVPGQNIQIFLPLYFKGNNVGYIAEPLACVVARGDSDSRKQRNEEEMRKYQQGIRDTYLDTLEKINMSEAERVKYTSIIRNRYMQYEHDDKRVFYVTPSDEDELSQLYSYDEQKFRNSYVSNNETANQTQLAAKLVFFSHSLEKSLSNDKFENGRGFSVAQWLIDLLRIYRDKSYDKNHLAYTSTLSVLQSFYERQKGTDHSTKLEGIFGEILPEIQTCESKVGGSFTISFDDKKRNNKKNFEELAMGRSAVRTYADKPVDKQLIKEVVEIAMKTPTVCNRQSVRVHAIYKKEIIDKVLEIQDGLAHYDTPPVLLLVTADDSGYVGPNERNQGFVDGGLFAMSILYALEYKRLAACPAHAMLTEVGEMSVRGMLGIPESEKLITFITVGHFKEENNVCKSFRYPAEYVLSEVDRVHEYSIETLDRPQKVEVENDSIRLKIRKKLRVRTRLKNGLRRLKHKTRVRTRVKETRARIEAYLEERKYKQVDGAILTLTGYFNYGNILQRWALQEFLRKNRRNFVSYADSLSAPVAIYRANENVQKYGWDNIIDFANRNIFMKPFDPNDTYRNYIVGSDQIWRNWWDSPEALGYYFLNFTKGRKTNRISYAASFGKDKIKDVMSPSDIKYVRPLIEDFDAISVREKSAINMIEKTWSIKNVKEVVDPTLLLNSRAYSKLINQSSIKNEKIQPIFTYILNKTDEIEDFISKIKATRNQQVTNIRADGGEEDGVLPPVELWLKGFRDAEFVVTNSFHGMMFAVINNTDFIVIGKESGGLSRILDFLEQYGLSERFVDEDKMTVFDSSEIKPIDWSAVNTVLEKRRKQSSTWLLESLK